MAKLKRKRNYRKEYDDFHGKKKQREERSSRNKARRKKSCPKGKEVHHKDSNPKNNKSSNLKCLTRKKNREIQPRRKKKGR
jgi:hypothetical protein